MNEDVFPHQRTRSLALHLSVLPWGSLVAHVPTMGCMSCDVNRFLLLLLLLSAAKETPDSLAPDRETVPVDGSHRGMDSQARVSPRRRVPSRVPTSRAGGWVGGPSGCLESWMGGLSGKPKRPRPEASRPHAHAPPLQPTTSPMPPTAWPLPVMSAALSVRPHPPHEDIIAS